MKLHWVFRENSIQFHLKTVLVISITLLFASLITPVFGLLVLLFLSACMFLRFQKLSVIEALALGVLSIFTLQIILYTSLVAAHIQLPLHYAFTFEGAFIILCFWILYRKHNSIHLNYTFINRSDVLALSAASVTLVVLLLPIIKQSGAGVAQFLSYGEDNASHYALTNFITQNNKLAYHTSPEAAGLIKSLEIYPQGYHVNAAIFSKALFLPANLNHAAFIKSYGIFIALIYCFMVFWAVKLCTRSLQCSNAVMFALLPAIIIVGGLTHSLLLLERGFQTQIFTYVYLLALIFVCSFWRGSRQNLLVGLLVSLYFMVGVSAGWWLLLPVSGLLLVAYTIKNRLVQMILAKIKYLFPYFSFLLLVMLYPIVINVILSEKHNPINEPGGISKLDWAPFLYTGLTVIALLIFASIRIIEPMKTRQFVYIIIALTGALTLTGAISLYQTFTIGHHEYFFYKTTYTVLFLLIITLFVGLALVLDKLYSFKRTTIFRFIIPICILVATFIPTALSKMVYARVYMNNWFPNVVELHDLQPLFTDDATRYKDALYAGDCVPTSDYLSNRWAGARYLSENKHRQRVEIANIFGRKRDANSALQEYLTYKRDFLLVIDERCAGEYPALQFLGKNSATSIEYTHSGEAKPSLSTQE